MRRPHLRQGNVRRTEQPVGVILAGGRGRRIGGSKATVELGGRPLISYPLRAMTAALEEVVVLAKADTQLPSLPGATVWIEPQLQHHPLIGITQAIGLAGGRAVVVCAADLPFVTPALIRRLAVEDAGGRPAVVAAAGAAMQPLLARYEAEALRLLPVSPGNRPLQDCITEIGPMRFEVDDPEALFNVNAPEDLLRASAILDRRKPTAGSRPSSRT
jgi:molybdopterin-guanine dinucleotide biosynthesis protein A